MGANPHIKYNPWFSKHTPQTFKLYKLISHLKPYLNATIETKFKN